jgi:hypothetical protein
MRPQAIATRVTGTGLFRLARQGKYTLLFRKEARVALAF